MALGDIVYRGAAVWLRLVGNTTSTRKFLRQTGTGAVSAAPAWDVLTTADLGTGTANSSTFLRGDLTWNTPTITRTVGVVIGDGTNVISLGVAGFVSCPVAGTITKVRLLSSDAATTSGSIVVDVWKDTYANYPPVNADSITSAAPPTISAATKSEDSTLTGWTTFVAAGDVFGFNVDSVTSLTRVTLELTVVA